MRFLAVDLGDRRTGLAVGDDETGLASPLSVVECAPAQLVERLADAIDDHAPDAIVIGLPLNMDGSEGPRAKAARAAGAALADRFDRPVHYQDERLTSFAAEGQLAQSGHTAKARSGAWMRSPPRRSCATSSMNDDTLPPTPTPDPTSPPPTTREWWQQRGRVYVALVFNASPADADRLERRIDALFTASRAGDAKRSET